MSMPTPSLVEINSQLELVLNSKEFNSSKRLKDFLAYVVGETLAGRGGQIKAYNIGVEVFKLSSDFDPSLNPYIRVVAGRLRAKLDQYYSTSNNNDKVCIEVPRGGYLPEFSYREPARSMGAAKEAAAKTAPVGEAKTPNAPSAEGEVSQARQRHSGPTIVVLPFSNLNGHKSLEPFLLGLAEEIANALTRFEELRVLNMHYSGAEDAGSQMGETSEARFMLGGSAQICGENTRLRVTLLDTTTHSHIWAEKFDGRLDGAQLFDLQDEITGQVVARIADSFGLINRRMLKESAEKRTAELEVYEALLYYHHWVISLTPQRCLKAKNALARAVELDPAYATTKAMLSDVYASHCQWGLHLFEDAVELSQTLADQALELDINNQYAHWAKAYNCYLRRDEKYFVESVHRAIELNPFNTNIIATAGMKLAMIGHSGEGLEMLNTALRLNPHLPCWYRGGLFIEHYVNEEYEAALDEAKHITTANFMWGHIMRTAAYGKLGLIEQGRVELASLLAVEPNFRKIGYEAMLLLFFQEKTVDKLLEGLVLSGL